MTTRLHTVTRAAELIHDHHCHTADTSTPDAQPGAGEAGEACPGRCAAGEACPGRCAATAAALYHRGLLATEADRVREFATLLRENPHDYPDPMPFDRLVRFLDRYADATDPNNPTHDRTDDPKHSHGSAS